MRTISQLKAILESEREWQTTFSRDANPNDPFDQMSASMCKQRVAYAERRLEEAVRAEHIAKHGAADMALTKAEVLDRLQHEIENQTTQYSYRTGLEWAVSLVKKLPPDDWQDVPDESDKRKLYWVDFTDNPPIYLHDDEVPVWLYKHNGTWYMSDPDTVYDEPLKGRRVAACVRPGGEL